MFFKIKELFKSIKYWFKWNCTKEKFQLVKEAITGNNFDYFYILKIERLKLKEMYSYYQKVWWIDSTEILRDLKLCISLLDYILDIKDVVKISNIKDKPSSWKYECVKYVNFRNFRRFISKEENELEYIKIFRDFPEGLYYRKAFHLYCKIRYYKTQNWWD